MPRILIVDDDVKFAEMVQVHLGCQQFEVIMAKDGEEGLG